VPAPRQGGTIEASLTRRSAIMEPREGAMPGMASGAPEVAGVRLPPRADASVFHRTGSGGSSSGMADVSREDRQPRSVRKDQVCHACQRPMTGQFVRALGNVYHLDCFRCAVRMARTY